MDAFKKSAFLFSNQLYKQVDVVLMGSSLGLVLENVVMTKPEKVEVKPLQQDDTTCFMLYVDDTLLCLVDVITVLQQLSSYAKIFNLR